MRQCFSQYSKITKKFNGVMLWGWIRNVSERNHRMLYFTFWMYYLSSVCGSKICMYFNPARNQHHSASRQISIRCRCFIQFSCTTKRVQLRQFNVIKFRSLYLSTSMFFCTFALTCGYCFCDYRLIYSYWLQQEMRLYKTLLNNNYKVTNQHNVIKMNFQLSPFTSYLCK